MTSSTSIHDVKKAACGQPFFSLSFGFRFGIKPAQAQPMQWEKRGPLF